MGLSLVAVFAIIATLGLMSLNQAAPVLADEHTVAGGSTIGTDEGPTVKLEFSSPASGITADSTPADQDKIIIRLPKFDLSEAQDTSTNYGIVVDGDAYDTNDYSVAVSNDDKTVTITLTSEDADDDIAPGMSVAITIMSGATIDVPDEEGTYPVTLDIEKAGTTPDLSNVAMTQVVVQNSVVVTSTMVEEEEEDVASGKITVMFTANMGSGALSKDDDDAIMIQLQDFQIGDINSADVTINNQNPDMVRASGDMVTLYVPDMDANMLLTQEIAAGAGVTVVFDEDADIMNPTNGGMFSSKVHTSQSTGTAAQMRITECHATGDEDDTTTPTGDGTCPGAHPETSKMEEVKVAIVPTMPDITKVELSNDVSGMATGMTVRFVTDDNLFHKEDSEDSWMRIHGEEGDVTSTDKIMLTMEDFTVPDFFPPNSVKINGRDVEVSDSDTETGKIELVMTHDIDAGNPVVITFLGSAGIMNPTLPVTDPPTESMVYPVMVKTDAEDEYGSRDATVMAAPPEQMIPPTSVEVMVDPDTAGSNTKLTVRFMTGSGGALMENDEITIMAPNFDIPNSIDSGNVTVNGSNPKSVAVSGDQIILTLKDPIRAERTVSVVFKMTAGINNPDKAGQVEVSVKTTHESMAAAMKVAIEEPPPAAMVRAIEVVPQVPGEDSRITLKFPTLMQLSSVESSEIIFRFHDNFKIEGGRIDVSKVTIQADSIDGGEVDTPEASGVENPTSATVTYETVDRKPQVRLAVPDMADDEGNQHINMNAVVTVVFQQGSGIMNPTEAEDYEIWHAVNNDANIEDNLLGMVVLPVVVSLSGDGGKRGTSVTAVAKGVEGGEAVLFWLDTETAMAGGSKTANAPDGVYDPNTEAVLCRATAESNDTATCVFEVQNPPFAPGMMLWVNVQDSEGRRVGPLSVDKDGKVGIKGAVSGGYMWDTLPGLAMHPINEAEVKLDARVTIKPSEVNIGDTVTVSMFDYASGSIHDGEIKIGGVELDLTAPGLDIRTRTSEGAGQRSFTFVIPATVVKNRGTDQEQVTPIPLGKVRVDVNVPKGAGDNTADTNITIAGATVTLSQPNILGNQTLSISGSGFSGRGAGNNRCIEQGHVLINNVAVEIIELEDSGQCRDKIELTSSGTFTLTVLLRRENGTIPDPLQTGGTHTVVITDNKGVEGRTSIEIPDRTLDVNPKTARPRTAVTVSGRNFVADNPDGSSVAVDLKYDCGGNVRRTVSAEPDASGNFEETLRVPDDCGIPSTNTITATVVIDGTETTTETTTHDIPEAEVQVAPNQGAIGSEITITGEGFRTFEGVSSIELGTKNVLGARVFYTDRDGKLDIGPFLVPGIDPGTYALVVGVGEAEERTTASVNYTVIDEGLPQRAPVAVLEGLEPLGEKLVRVFRFNNATKTWEFYDPRPEFAEANTITQLFGGNVYWLNITEDVEAVLGGKTRRLTCIEGDCWNQIVW